MGSLADAARAACEAAGLTEPVPGEHVWFDEPEGGSFPGTQWCAWCGVCKRRDGKPQKPCKGIVHVELRSANEPAERPVVFLDIDGVLNHAGWFRTRGPMPAKPIDLCSEVGARWALDPAAAQRLNRLNRLHDAGAAVVISSTWRTFPNAATELPAMLRALGFRGEVIGMTPDLTSHAPGSTLILSGKIRGDEIRAWLDANGNPERFVILDDEDDMGPLLDRLVQTSFDTGLLDEHVDAALALLQREVR